MWRGNRKAVVGLNRAGLAPNGAEGRSLVRIAGRTRQEARESHETGAKNLQNPLESLPTAPPCFFHRECGGKAEVEKQGKAVCRPCAEGLNGVEYALRAPSREPLYWKAEELVLQLEMKERGRKRGGE